jgi:antigen flippase
MLSDRRKSAVPAPPHEMPKSAEMPVADESTYGEILRSSALIGGSAVLSTAITIIRTKVLAVLLGPAGFGLIGVYGSISDLARSIAGMGINNSGVRQIAEAVASGDAKRIARTITVLRRISILFGLLGAALLFISCVQISMLTFGSEQHTAAVALLSVAVFFRLVADGQGALIQGMRRISDLAKMRVLGALFGTIVSIPLVYFFREDGVVPSLIGIAAMSVVTSWWYSHNVKISRPAMTASQAKNEVGSLLKFGLAFMANGFLTMGAAYAVRIMVLRNVGLEEAGLYQAAWSLGGLYCDYIYQGIFADFYPRLVGAAQDNRQCNRMVNEQTQAALLFAGPGVIATLTFAPLAIALFYSPEFYAAVDVLRWICIGAAFRVVYQPIGFIIVAKGQQKLFLLTELAWAAANVGLAWLSVRSFGLSGAGIAFLGSYAFYGLMMYPIARRQSNFRWSAANRKTSLIFFCLIAVVFCGFYVLPHMWAIFAGTLAMVLSAVYSIRVLANLVSLKRVPRRLRRLLVLCRLLRSETTATVRTSKEAATRLVKGNDSE